MNTTVDTGILTGYPESWHGVGYARLVWPVGERPDGWLVEGHDRRAWAAASQISREARVDIWYDGKWNKSDVQPLRGEQVSAVWVLFHTRCGCTAEQHAGHVERCGCVYPGMPPCWEGDDDVFGWMYEKVPADTANALPVLEVQL